ncbi:MAG: adenylate/guanylate cyclase domain-containing protein, partial [Kiloniellales bacterium]
LAADVVGYSRLMGADEAGTLARLKAHRAELIDPKIAERRGRIVKLMGDGTLVEFASVVDAVQCALDIQRAMAERNAGVPEDRRIALRIGVNLGDVIVEGDDIYGDGVNVAARLEGCAEPGGICISAVVHDQVRGKVDASFRDLGEQALKNIDRPVRISTWEDSEAAAAAPAAAPHPALAAGKPSVLVAPFRQLGREELGGTLAEALTESISVALSHFDELDVVDPGTVPAGTDTEAGRRLAQRFGALYILEGRVQAAGQQTRLSVQLTEVASGQRKWSESFDREAGDLFALQDELTAIVASTTGEAILDLMAKALAGKPENELTAYDFVIRGTAHLHLVDLEENKKARADFERGLALEPELPLGIICLAWTYALELIFGWPSPRADALDYCIGLMREVLRRNDRYSKAHRLLARLLHLAGAYDEALEQAQRCHELNPYDSDMILTYGISLICVGRAKEGVALVERAMRINPYAPAYYAVHLALGYFVCERYEEAITALKRVGRPVANSRFILAASLAMVDRRPEAAREIEAILDERPGYNLAAFAESLSLKEGPARARYLAALEKAGLPV